MNAVILALALVAQEDNPCAGPPNAACERILAEASLHWEKKYHEERMNHLDTLETCSEMAAQKEQLEEDTGATIYWISGAVVAVLGAIGITYAVAQ